MNIYNPCIGCEYYGKPYWSVVSPCNNCPKTAIVRNVTAANLTITNYDTIINLPSAEEYREAANKLDASFTSEWSEPKYGDMEVMAELVYTKDYETKDEAKDAHILELEKQLKDAKAELERAYQVIGEVVEKPNPFTKE